VHYDIVSMGALLVEIMRKERDRPLSEPADFAGPFASGDTPIFIGQAARLGNRCLFLGVVGEDDFGDCVLGRLRSDGVDVSRIRLTRERTTAVTFVSYASDGSRRFLYHVTNAAAGLFCPDDVDELLLQDIDWLHVTGFSLVGSESTKQAFYKALKTIPDTVKVSFDPNIRPEILSVEQIRELCGPALDRADLVIPSRGEAMLFTGADTDDEGCRILQERGKIVVLKRGELGCRIFSSEGVLDIPTFEVEEVDPTGAGDSFCAALLTCLREGRDLYETGLFANAVGAMSVRRMGPMEGQPWRDEVESFMAENGANRVRER